MPLLRNVTSCYFENQVKKNCSIIHNDNTEIKYSLPFTAVNRIRAETAISGASVPGFSHFLQYFYKCLNVNNNFMFLG